MKYLIVIMLMISSQNFALACDPNDTCMMNGPSYPCGSWYNPADKMCTSRIQNPVCAANVVLCRSSCATTNSNINNNISNDNASIQQIDTSIGQNLQMQASTDSLLSGNTDSINKQTSLCADIQNSRNDYLNNATK